MKKIIIVLVILLIISGGFLYVNSKGKSDTKTDQLSSSDTIYTNSKFNYQLTLPKGWRVLDESSDGQNLVITNSIQPSMKSMYGPDKIVIGLTHFESSYIDNTQEKNSSTGILQKITLNQGYKGFLREELTPGKLGTVVGFDFGGSSILTTGDNSGKTANGISILLSGAVDKDLLINLANSFKSI